MVRFYGFSDGDLVNMDMATFSEYSTAMEIIEARETLVLTNVDAFPKLKEQARSKYLNGLNKTAYPTRDSDRVVTTEELAKILQQGS